MSDFANWGILHFPPVSLFWKGTGGGGAGASHACASGNTEMRSIDGNQRMLIMLALAGLRDPNSLNTNTNTQVINIFEVEPFLDMNVVMSTADARA